MAATTMSMPAQINNGGVTYPTLHAYNDALYEYTRKQFEDAERAARRQRERQTSSANSKPRTTA